MQSIIQNPNPTDLILALIIVVIAYLLTHGVVRFILRQTIKLIPERIAVIRNVITAFENPIRIVVFSTGFLIAMQVAGFATFILNIALSVFRSVLMFSIGYGIYGFSGQLTEVLTRLGRKANIETDSIVMPFITRIVQFVVMLTTVAIILSDWGINVNGIFAGLGLAGLAVSMAAQDPIKNFFSGVAIITGKPFQIGDWIQTPSVEGEVEDISFRSVYVRTSDGAVVIVPNITITSEPLTNWSRLKARKLAFVFFLDLSSSTKDIEKAITKIQKLFLNDERFKNDKDRAYVSNIGKQGIELTISTTYRVKKFDTSWTDVRGEINLAIMKILEQQKLKLAKNNIDIQ
ncbi:MAG: mechanosensitive ion channel family protein [Lactobacillaceae bacterium]|jgi:MscS family membrane protein|nr:mechanosensitive ion channel family protein [Lactobacillaceae bacterium]